MNRQIIYIVCFLVSVVYGYKMDQYFGTFNFNDNNINSPFLGGFNKPKIQWIDWDNDNDVDLFLLDEDGSIKYFKNNECNNNECDLELVTTSFQNINNIDWFYFSNFDSDSEYELITQNSSNISTMNYYDNQSGQLVLISGILDNNGEEITIDAVMTPTFADIDGDSDMDLFVGNYVGTVTFYENIGLEFNVPSFEYITNYWQEIYIVGASLNQRHGASAINFIDLDNDLDLDLAWGDYFQQSLYIIFNDGDANNPMMDINNIIDQYPTNNPIVTAGLNMPSFADIDQDGDQDLFVTVISGAYGFQLINNFYYYENVSNNEESDFVQVTDNFINTFDLLSDVNPEYVDFDGDSDMDLVVGTDFDPQSFPWSGKLVVFENIGYDENNEPEWQLIDDQYLGNDLGNNLSPAFVDIDSDLDKDLFIGNFNGTIQYFENIGSINNPIYSYSYDLDGIDLAGYSTPEFLDLDNDEDFDLIVGNLNGNIYYYENIGNNQEFNFHLVDEYFQDINVQSRSNPLVYDFDKDFDLDLFVGSAKNGIICYENIGDESSYDFIINNEKSYFNIGNNISPEHYSGDNQEGFVLGLSTGGMYYLPLCSHDFNNDTEINIIDIILLISYILDDFNENDTCYDLNSDSSYDILDVVLLVNYIIGNQ